MKLATQEIPVLSKETRKTVLKMVSENPALSVEDLTITLKNNGSKITQEEIFQVIQGISPNKNWHRATVEEIQKEILDYLWTLESEILFMLPTKQKETTIAEFNQIRLQNKQVKVPKDLIRHIQALLMVDGKNLARFRKFEKESSVLNDVDVNVQATWAVREILANVDIDKVTSVNELSNLLISQFREKLQSLTEKVGKTTQRICERFVEKYFPKNITDTRLKELILLYQKIYHNYKNAVDINVSNQSELQDQHKLVDDVIEELKSAQEIVSKSHEGGFLSKLFIGKVKNKDGIIKKLNNAIEYLNQLGELNSKSNKIINEKILLMQKLQSDYENIVFVKSQLENDLHLLNDKLKNLEEKNASLNKESQGQSELLEKTHEKIASLQQKVDLIPELESKISMLREELDIAKGLSLKLYSRIIKIKSDLQKQSQDTARTNDKVKSQKLNSEQKNNTNHTIHKVQQDPETGSTTIITSESNLIV